MHIYTYTYTHIYIHLIIHTITHIYIYIYTQSHTYIHTPNNTHNHTHIYTYIDGETSGGGESDEDMNSDGVIAEDGIERLASSLGGKTIGGPLMMAITQLLSSPDPIHRRAAIVGCNRFCEGCSGMIIKTNEISKILEIYYKGIQDDASPRVQYQALQGLGRCCTLFPSSIINLLNTFLPLFVNFLANPTTCARIKGHTASALINLVNPTVIQKDDDDDYGGDSNNNTNTNTNNTNTSTDGGNSPISILKSQLDGLVGALINCLQSAPLEVQSPCLVVLG